MFLSLVFTLWSFPIAFYAVWFKLQVSDNKEPRLCHNSDSLLMVSQAWYHQEFMGGCSSHLPFCFNLLPPRTASWRICRMCLIMSEGYFWSCCYEWCLKQPRGGKSSVCSVLVFLHCSSQNELRPSLTVLCFFLIIFIAANLVQCFLTQLIEVPRTKVPKRQEGFRDSCVLDNQHRPGCDKVSSFPQQGDLGRWESFRAFCACWTRLFLSSSLRFQGMDISPAATSLGKHWVTFDMDCSPEYENPSVLLPAPQALCLPVLYFKAFSCTSKALTPQSLIKEIKRNFTRLNQKQIYRIRGCRIKNSGWKGETLKYSM